jgi:hypothetical protein
MMADPDIELKDSNNNNNNEMESLPVATATAIPISTNSNASAPVFSVGTGGATTAAARGTQPKQLSGAAIAELRQQGYPAGLAYEMGNTVSTYPIRFWIVDNSGSMRTSDGNEVRCLHSTGEYKTVVCTRWKELQGTMEYHAELAGLLQATTIFRFLNDPGPNIGPQEFSIGETIDSQVPIRTEVARAIGMFRRTEPNGVTPLAVHIRAIHDRIAATALAQQLQHDGQRAVVVIATDGLPSNDGGYTTDAVKQEFVQSLRQLQTLPVWVVIRLCTDDPDVVSYYNALDAILELPLEVIDDYVGEAAEVYAVNKWLNYTLPLHRCREMGYQVRVWLLSLYTACHCCMLKHDNLILATYFISSSTESNL